MKTGILTRVIGSKTQTIENEYTEIGIAEVENMLEKVRNGGNETELREKLVREA